jgi:outer membrane protein TolC
LFKKPQLEKQLARAEFEVASADLEYRFQSLRSALAKTLFETGLGAEKVRIVTEDTSWLETMVLTTESRYRAGQSGLNEVLQVQNELAKRANEVQTLKLELGQKHFLLNRMLNRAPDAGWPLMKLPEIAPPVVYSQKLMDLSTRYEPRLRVIRQEVRKAEAGVNVARRKSWPDFTVGFEGRNFSGDGEFRQGMGTLKLNLPWFNSGKYKQEVRKNEALKHATELELADYQLDLRQDIHKLTVQIDAARREALLYRDQIIPRSETALASARSSWESGRATFRDVLDARRMLLEGRLMYARAVEEQYVMLSELVLCCGLGDLEALFMLYPNLNAQDSDAKPSSKP